MTRVMKIDRFILSVSIALIGQSTDSCHIQSKHLLVRLSDLG